jgi:phospholipase D1/2
MMRGEKDTTDGRKRSLWKAGLILAVLLGMAAAWRWTPLAQWINIHKIWSWALFLRNYPGSPIIFLIAYLVGSLLLVPVTILIIATAFAFGPMEGILYSLAGCLLGACATYAVGYLSGQGIVRRIAGSKWKSLEGIIHQSGIIAVATMRLLPIAPFTIVNIVSGAFHIRARDFFLGTLIGLTPGIVAINFFQYQLENTFRNPGIGSFAYLGGLVALVAVAVWWIRSQLGKQKPTSKCHSSPGK